jgi:hypothetical protein
MQATREADTDASKQSLDAMAFMDSNGVDEGKHTQVG